MRIAAVPGGPLGRAMRSGKEIVVLGEYVKASMRKVLEAHQREPFDLILTLGGSGMEIPPYKDSASGLFNLESDQVSIVTSDSFTVQSLDATDPTATAHHSQACAMKCWLLGMAKGRKIALEESQVVALGGSMNTVDNVKIDFWPWYEKKAIGLSPRVSFFCSKIHWARIKLTLGALVVEGWSQRKHQKALKFMAFKNSGDPLFRFIDCGEYEYPLLKRMEEWGIDTLMWLLALCDPLGETWLSKKLFIGRKERRLVTGR